MNSFKLFNRTNKNVNVSNNLNGKESKEKDHSKSNHKKNISTSTLSCCNIGPTNDKSIEETNNCNKNIYKYNINENADDNKENISNVDQSIKNKENQTKKLSKKEKNKKKKEKKKNKKNKNKKNKLNNEQKELSSPNSSKTSSRLHFADGFIHHSSSLSKKNSITGKFTGKQPVRKLMTNPKNTNNIQHEVLIKSYNENTQFQKNSSSDIKEKQSCLGYSSNEIPDATKKERYISNGDITLTRPVRRESIIIGVKNNNIPIKNQENNNIITEENVKNVNITTSSTTTTASGKDHFFKFNFDNDSAFNLLVCVGMETPSSPAFSSITPINGNASYNISIGEDFGNSFFSENASNGDNPHSTVNSYKLENMFKKEKEKEKEGSVNKRFSRLHGITEEKQAEQENVKELKNSEVPKEFNKHNIVEEKLLDEEKYKIGKQKQCKESKKKDKKANHNKSNPNSNSSVSSNSGKTSQHSVHSTNSAILETKKAWHNVRKLFGKNKNNSNSRKSYRDSFSTSIDDSIRHNNCHSSGIIYDWDELRRRMELEENSTVCSESLTAREFAEAIGIPIISSSDEEDDLRLNATSNGTLNGNQSLSNGYTCPSIYTHHSAKSSGPKLDMSIFIPPDKEEKKNNSVKHESLLNPDQTNASIKTAYSFASSTTQDYLDKLGNDSKRKVYEDSQSVSNRELNLHRYGQGNLRGKIYDDDSVSLSLHNERILESPIENIYNDTQYCHSVPYHVNRSSSSFDYDNLQSKPSWSNSNNKSKLNLITTNACDSNSEIVKHEDNKQELTLNDNKSINKKEELNGNNEMMKKQYPELLKSTRKSFNNIGKLEEEKSQPLSKDITQITDNVNTKTTKCPSNLGRRTPSISSVRSYKTYTPPVVKSYKGEEAMVQEYQKGRFTVTKPIYPSSGHRVFIVTKDEENENGGSVTTISSISSPGKVALRKRSSSQPASFFNTDPDGKSISPYQKKGKTSLLKFDHTITESSEIEPQEVVKPRKSNSLMATTSHSYSNDCFSLKNRRRSLTSSMIDSNDKKSFVSADVTSMNTGYDNSFMKIDTENQDDTLSEQFILTKNDIKLDKGKKEESLYSLNTNKSVSSLHGISSSPNQNITNASPFSRTFKPKNSNSRFQVTYTPGPLSSSKSTRSLKSIDSSISKANLTKKSTRILKDDTNSLEQINKGNSFLSEPVTESNGIIINHSPTIYNSFTEEERIDHTPSSGSLGIKTNANMNTGIPNCFNQSLNNNNNQRTVSSLTSSILDNAVNSNKSSPAISTSKISPYYGAARPISLHNTTSADNVLPEKINVLDNSTYSTSSPHKIHDTSNDYYNFLKYNDSYNSIYLSNSSKDNEKSEKENNTILDDMDKTEDNEMLSEMDKTNDLSESSPSTPYYHHLNTPMEKPPIIPNSPISYKSISSLNNNNIEENASLINKLPMKENNNSNESFTIFDKDLTISGDESFHEVNSNSLGRNNSKVSSNSISSPTVKPNLLTNNNSVNSLSLKSNLGHYRSPSVSSTNSSSRFTVTILRDNNEIRSPNYSSAKITNQRSSNLHNSTSIPYNNDSISNEILDTVPSSKLKPSVVVIKKPEDKSKSNGGNIVTTQSKNIGRFTVTRETIVS